VQPPETREQLAHRVVTLHTQKVAARAIARALGISRNTVRKFLVAHGLERQSEHHALVAPKRAPRASKLDPFKARVTELLETYPEITAQRIFEELRKDGFDGGYTTVKRHVRAVRPRPVVKPSLSTPDYGPGEMAECDWSPYTIDFTHAPRQVQQAFAYVLPCSHRKYYEFFERSDLHALMAGHAATFQRFEGCAHRCKYDSQKAVVMRWEGSQPIYNPRFLAFATYYEFRPVACRRFHPNDKPHVERAFWELVRSFFNGRRFRDPDDLRRQLASWLNDVADQRLYHKRTVLDHFAQERPHLRPLPAHPYDTARVVYRLCSMDGFVAWDGNQYAVPYEHVTDILPVRITQRELLVYAPDLRCIARHELAPRGAGQKLDPQQLHPPARHKPGADLGQLRSTFEQMGECSLAFFQDLCIRYPRLAAHHARHILLLRERYETASLDRALEHARTFGAFEHQAIARILAARSKPRTLDEYVTEQTARSLEQTLGSNRGGLADLTVFDALPRASAQPAVETTSPESSPCPKPSIPPTNSSASDSSDTSSCSD
jgi:transposase